MFYGWINIYVGIPFEEKGRTHAGVDCWGLIRLIYSERFGIELPSYEAEYETTKDGAAIQNTMELERGKWAAVSEPVFGDLAVFAIGPYRCHVGMVLAPGLMIHSERGADVAVERYDRIAWSRSLRGIYRHNGMKAVAA